MKSLFRPLTEAIFVNRPNRFIIECLVDNKSVRASMPNTGAMGELLFKGVTLLLEDSSEGSKYPYRTVGVIKDGMPLSLDTMKSNAIAGILLEKKKIPSLKDYKLIQYEVPYKNSRFDLLLSHKNKNVYGELKACTLFTESLAMFPDAVTERGTKHLNELGELAGQKDTRCTVIFLVHSCKATHFLPNYHTDPVFASTLYSLRNKIKVIALSVQWSKKLELLVDQSRELCIPWEIVKKENENLGFTFVILHCEKETTFTDDSDESSLLQKGYYVFVDIHCGDLVKRVQWFKRTHKRKGTIIEAVKNSTKILKVLPVRTQDKECFKDAQKDIKKISQWDTKEHNTCFFGFSENPFRNPKFHDILLYYRMGRLEKSLLLC